jgi:hypothetical protein
MSSLWKLTGLALIALAGCNLGTSSTSKPNLSAAQSQISIGQSTTITMTLTGDAFRSDRTDLTQTITAFIYSPASDTPGPYRPAPYVPLTSGFDPQSDPKLFPVSVALEVVIPTTGANNVPPRIPVTIVNGVVKATFEVRGRSTGTVILRGAYVWSSVQFPEQFVRVPQYTDFDGEVTIQVVP